MVTVIPRKIAATSVNGVAVTNDGSITLPVDSTPTSNSTNLVTSGGVKTELDALTTGLAGKQDTLTFDTTPTSGSTNPVTSKGVYNAEYDTRNTIAIVVPGSIIRQDVAKGQYVIWQGALYTATQDIVSYTVPSTSILQAVQNGGLNAVKSSVDTLNSKMTDVLSSNAGAHNSIYRGKYLGTSVTPAQYTAIANGTFDDLYLGDYWTIGGHNWVICDFDYYIQCGSSYGYVTRHHLVMMPSNGMNIPAGTVLYGTSDKLTLLDGENAFVKNWNATSSTAGGYQYSRMRTVIMKAANTIVINAFGSDHVLPFEELYPYFKTATDSGLASGCTWFRYDDQSNVLSKSICDLCNETMVYGQQVWGRGSAYTNVGYEIGYDKFQLAIFALQRDFANIRRSWWLRSVSSNEKVACVDSYGKVGDQPSGTPITVRPRFLLVGDE